MASEVAPDAGGRDGSGGRSRLAPLAVVRRSREAWGRVAPFLGISRWRMLALGAGAVLSGLVEVALLALIAAIATALSRGDTRIEADLGPVTLDAPLGTLFAVGFGVAVARTALQAFMAYLPAAMSADVMASLRRKLFDAFTDTAWPVQAAERDGHFQSLMGSHVGTASRGVITLSQAIGSFFMFGTLLLGALTLSLPTAVLLIVLSSALFVLMRPLSRRTRRYAKLLSEETMEYSKSVQEVVRLAEETQVFGATDGYRGRVHGRIEEVRVPLTRSRFLSGLVPVLYQSVAVLVLLVALLVVSRLETSSLASLSAVVLLLVRSLTYGQQLQGALTRMQELAPFMDRLRDGIDVYLSHPRQDGDQPMPAVATLGMRDVRFAYLPGDDVLDGVSFDVAAGEAVGIVGPSGAGKSTLVQLLLRLRDPDEGVYHVNGRDVREIQLAEWQRRVAYIPQSPLLMWGTVAENIRYHRSDLTMADVERAAHLASIHDEVRSWPKGYDTVIGERASAISGGQRQRLCLARALVARPEVVILDEPTSALDVRSEALIQESLQQLKGETILFMVAHRLSTLSVCDRVMVVVDGRLQAFDTPQRLLEVSPYYRQAIEITREQSRV